MILLLDCPNNSLKDSIISITKEYLEYKNIITHILKYPPFKCKKKVKEAIDFSKKVYNQMFRILNKINSKNTLIICENSYIQECIYMSLFYKVSGDYVFDIEKKYIKKFNDIALIILLPSIDKLSDFKSEEIINNFYRDAFNVSCIPTKILVEKADKMSIDFLFEKYILPLIQKFS